jgi:hypothetical protein
MVGANGAGQVPRPHGGPPNPDVRHCRALPPSIPLTKRMSGDGQTERKSAMVIGSSS